MFLECYIYNFLYFLFGINLWINLKIFVLYKSFVDIDVIGLVVRYSKNIIWDYEEFYVGDVKWE